MKFTGRAYVFGDDIDTDQIVPGRYLELVTAEEIAPHAMEGVEPGFSSRFVPGSIIVGGKNFGCGSSREHAPIALKAIGASCVLAESFGRIFYRNAINIGLPVMRCPGISAHVKESDVLSCDISSGEVSVLGTGLMLKAERIPPDVAKIIQDGGLIESVRKQLKRQA